jgi:hypothetical protein
VPISDHGVTLKCCALGFSEADLRILETLVSMFRSKLQANWVIEAGWDPNCGLILCDADTDHGRDAWRQSASVGILRAAVTAGAGATGDLVLHRPLRGHGPFGLVQVLNAASSRATSRAPEQARPAPMPITIAAPPPPQPARAAPAAAPPALVSTRAAAMPLGPTATAPMTARVPATPAAPPPPAVPAAMPTAPAQPPMPAAILVQPRSTGMPPQPEKPARKQAEKAREEDELLDALHRMRYQSRGIPMQEWGLLAALRRALAMQAPAVLYLPGLHALCILPQERAYYTEAPVADIARILSPEPMSVRVVPYGDAAEAREAAGTIDSNPRSIDQLTWLACVRCPEKDTSRHETSVYRLRRWPDLGQVPHEPHHLRWCGVLSRQPSTLRALAAATGSAPQDVAAFLDACAELLILESRPATEADLAAITVPEVSQQTKQVRERISLLRTILSKLGIRK